MSLPEAIQPDDATHVLFRGRRLIYFGGCDYYRLARHPKLLKAHAQAAARDGLAARAVRNAARRALGAEIATRLQRLESAAPETLSLDEGGARDVSSYIGRLGLQNLPAYLDPAGRILQAFQVGKALPLSLIIDHRGRVMGYIKGAADWTSPEARALIDYYVGHISP